MRRESVVVHGLARLGFSEKQTELALRLMRAHKRLCEAESNGDAWRERRTVECPRAAVKRDFTGATTGPCPVCDAPVGVPCGKLSADAVKLDELENAARAVAAAMGTTLAINRDPRGRTLAFYGRDGREVGL